MRYPTAPRSLAIFLAGILATRALPQSAEKLAGLGGLLFSSTALSGSGSVSCATCHDPGKSFADGRAEAEGQMKVAVGRNTPTLFAIGAIERFRDPAQATNAKPGRSPRVLTLEERCLEPLENELEMGSSAEVAASSLRLVPGFAPRFNEAFGDQGGVTKVRIGKALAAFIRTIDAPKAPYEQHLAGRPDALGAAERRGLDVFKSRGCAECHSGPALSDGRMHVVDAPWGQRMLDRQRTASQRRIELLRREHEKHKTVADVERMSVDAIAREARLRAPRLPGGGGYDPDQIEVQTATLWDVKRTAPYFRDGSVKSLEDAVRIHVREMNVVRHDDPRLKNALAALDRAGKRSPAALRATAKTPVSEKELPEHELHDLVEFLSTLSPRETPTRSLAR